MRIASQGGNAVDIAIAAALTACVSEILMCSLGGSGFMMLRLPDGTAELIDGADQVPGLGGRVPDPSRNEPVLVPYGDGIWVGIGASSVAVPGFPALLDLAYQRHGSLPWPELVAPALDVARDGFNWPRTLGRWLEMAGESIFLREPESAQGFVNQQGKGLAAGDRFQDSRLVAALEEIARRGLSCIYSGEIGAAFAEDIQRRGGVLGQEDLNAYQAVVRKPATFEVRGSALALNPPPAVGGVAAGFLIGLLADTWREGMTAPEYTLWQIDAQRRLLDLRENTVADAAPVQQTGETLLDPHTIAEHGKALKSPSTTHLSVATEDGGLVALSMSMGYGAGLNIPDTGIPLNNTLGELEIDSDQGLPTPGRRFVTNMCPTVARSGNDLHLAFGSPGAARITTAIAQTWARHLLEVRSPEEAVAAPRVHLERTPSGELRVFAEPGIDTSAVSEDYPVTQYDEPMMYFGSVTMVSRSDKGELGGVADPRRDGAVRYS